MKLEAIFFTVISIFGSQQPASAASNAASKAAAVQVSSQSVDRTDEFKTKMSLERSQLKILIKSADCVGDGECDYLELGESRCGGPSGYVVYSSNNPDLAAVKAHAANYTASEKGYNTLSTDAVDCKPPQVPDPKCQKQRCVDAAHSKSAFDGN